MKSESPNPLKTRDRQSHEKRSADTLPQASGKLERKRNRAGRRLGRRCFGGTKRRALPCPSRLDPRLARLSETAKNYARAARAENTARAYDSDWRQFASWLRRNGFDELPPEPQTVGLYLAAQAEAGVSVATLERRLSGICWRYRQLGTAARRQRSPHRDGFSRHSPQACASARAKGGDLRRRAFGHARHARHGPAGPARPRHPGARFRRRPCAAPKSSASTAAPARARMGPAGSRSIRPARIPTTTAACFYRSPARPAGARSRSAAAPAPKPAPSRCSRPGCGSVGSATGRCFDRSPARTAASPPSGSPTSMSPASCRNARWPRGFAATSSEGERKLAFGGHSLRAGLASSAQIEEAHVQKHLGHASAEMTRRYQRKRDRFKVNLTKAAGL